MKNYLSILSKVKLFNNIEESEILSLMTCLEARINNYEKGEFIFTVGDKVDTVGIILRGSAHIIRENIEGDRTIISTLGVGDYFAEAICCAGVEESPVSVQVSSDSTILLLNFSHILHTCHNSCMFHTKLIENMLYVIANKNIALQNRMEIISQKSLRLKVINYLQTLAMKQGNNITIPFNREEFADFLCVDRSSLSHELSRMKEDGLIDYHKSNFRLL